MRAIWKGAVSFGLVNVPVKVYSATGEKDIRFHQVHRSDGGRIKYRRVCSVDGEEVSYDEIAKGYETSDGQLVVLTDDDLASLPLSTGREIDVVEFVPAEQVDPVLFGKSYYLEPDARSVKPYALLREALRSADRMAVVKVALRQRETLAVLRVRDDVIVLQMLLWPDEVRDAAFDVLDSDVELRPQELQMAASLVESLAADFDPSQFHDGYAEAVAELVEAKVSSGDTRSLPRAEEDEGAGGAEVVDLLTALQRSVERARGGAPAAGAAGARTTEAAKETTARKTTAKGTTAKGTTAKKAAEKTTAKETTAKRATAKRATAKRATAKKAAEKTTAAKKTTAKEATAKKATTRTRKSA